MKNTYSVYNFIGFCVGLKDLQGRFRKIQKGVAGTLAHLPTCQQYYRYFHFSESFLKITQNFKEKGWPRPPRPTPNSPTLIFKSNFETCAMTFFNKRVNISASLHPQLQLNADALEKSTAVNHNP